MNFQRCECAFHHRQAWVRLQLILCLLLLTVLQLCHLPPPLPPPSVTLVACSLDASHLHASCCTMLLCFSRYCTVRLKMFHFCLFFMYYLCDKYYKPITVQYHVANCVNWAPRLTLLDLWTNWTDDCVLRVEFVCTLGTNYSLRMYRGRKRPRRELQDHWTFKS